MMSSSDISEETSFVCEKQGSVHHYGSNQSIQDKKTFDFSSIKFRMKASFKAFLKHGVAFFIVHTALLDTCQYVTWSRGSLFF